MSTALDTREIASATPRLRVADWLWRPWYAKLWWTTILIYWLGMATSSTLPVLADFYSSALAGFLNVLFFPMTALMVLGVGYVQTWLEGFSSAAGGSPFPAQGTAMVSKLEEQHARAFEELNAITDINDPRSGSLWIGNPLSFQYPNRRL
ncbi:hypothetical protein AWL63_18780 [Sphingomonas panacis]|uniref:Uncharacterized protein n=1 Tax=Sphingomonas panacis TaxID=1560345 RepID=A0A1B3ZE22_9SPHN|nr:hypothetical protein [Sphingomonas panacis]AOH85679.1 hypothetical protein AWL63_18780 [Sphingomonas panacis]